MTGAERLDDSSAEFASNAGTLVFLLTVYYLAERCLRAIAVSCMPRFYNKLRASQKDRIFFGISMGLLITLLSTPSCANATRDAWYSGTNPANPWSLGPHARMCITSRAILWVSELNRLDMYTLYVVHHIGAILALVSWLTLRWPNLLFLIFFTTLVSEIPGDMVFLLSMYREMLGGPKTGLDMFRVALVRFNAVQYAGIRGAGIGVVAWLTWKNTPGIRERSVIEQAYGYGLMGFYTIFCASYVYRQLSGLKKLNVAVPVR